MDYELENFERLKTKPTYTIIDDTEFPGLLYEKKFKGIYAVKPIEEPIKYDTVPLGKIGKQKEIPVVRPKFIKEDNIIIYYDQNRKNKVTPTMEDYYKIFDYTEGKVYVVLDGHGGDTSAKYVAEVVESVFTQMFNQNPEYISLIHDIFLFLNGLLEEKFPHTPSGTTMTMVVHDKTHGKVYLANVGDSKAILFQEGEVLLSTIDHRYNESIFENERIDKIVKEGEDLVKELLKSNKSPEEISKILQESQKDYQLVYNRRNNSYYIQKYYKNFADSSSNQPSSHEEEYAQNTRSLGDFRFKGAVIPVPFIYECDLNDKQNVYLLVASDGLWDAYIKVYEEEKNIPQLIVNKIQKENILNDPMMSIEIKQVVYENVFKLVYIVENYIGEKYIGEKYIGEKYIGEWSKDNIMIILSKLT